MTQPQWHFMEQWLHSPLPEAPLLLSGPGDTDCVDRLVLLARCSHEGQKPCGTCVGCTAAVTPDIIFVSSETAVIRISDLRTVWEALRFSSLQKRRLVIIPQAERLTVPAAHALLKSLEDSLPSNRFILTAQMPRTLLPTIASRCHHIRLTQATTEVLQQTSVVLHDSLLDRLSSPDVYTDDDIDGLAQALGYTLNHVGPSAELRIGMMRLRDYYRIKSVGGNMKLAREVLLASLPVINS